MKRTFTSIFCVILATGLYAANPVPNSGFESWVDANTATSWSSSTGGTITKATVAADVHSGAAAAKGSVVVTSSTFTPVLSSPNPAGFPITLRHAYLEFWYKVNLANGGGAPDKFIAQVACYDASSTLVGYNLVSNGTITTNASTYAFKQVPIVWVGTNPVKAIITFTVQPQDASPNPHNGTYFIVDDVDLSNTLIGIDEIEESTKLQIFPNPVVDNLRIRTEATKPMQITLSDALGRVVMRRLSSAPVNGVIQDTVAVESLSSGMYLLMLSSDKKTIFRRVIID
jgi:hypothetical protein